MNTEEIRIKLEEQIKKTAATVEDYEELTKPVGPDDSIGRLSRMDAIQNKSVAEAALRQARQKLSHLKHALAHIDHDDFGICARCKQPIPIGRILIRPESAFCVRCAG